MPAFAITGSIGSGKSSVLHSLGILLNSEIFSADQENGRILDNNQEVRQEICRRLGDSCYHADQSANRKHLFNLISHNLTARYTLESILHPRLQQLWKPQAYQFSQDAKRYFLAEIPLLYEKGLELFFNKTIVVGCSPSLRMKRLQHNRGLSDHKIAGWQAMQLSQDEKIAKADYLLWNDGSPAELHHQLQYLASSILHS